MLTRSRAPRILAHVVAVLWLSTAARAQDVRVMTSGAFTEACTRLAPAFEQATGHAVTVTLSPQDMALVRMLSTHEDDLPRA